MSVLSRRCSSLASYMTTRLVHSRPSYELCYDRLQPDLLASRVNTHPIPYFYDFQLFDVQGVDFLRFISIAARSSTLVLILCHSFQ